MYKWRAFPGIEAAAGAISSAAGARGKETGNVWRIEKITNIASFSFVLSCKTRLEVDIPSSRNRFDDCACVIFLSSNWASSFTLLYTTHSSATSKKYNSFFFTFGSLSQPTYVRGILFSIYADDLWKHKNVILITPEWLFPEWIRGPVGGGTWSKSSYIICPCQQWQRAPSNT